MSCTKNRNRRLLFIFGTRPEAIKLAPIIREVRKKPESFQYRVCATAQHREMLDQVLKFFAIKPDYDLGLMKPNQSLFEVTADGLKALGKVLEDWRPDVVMIQGDTTTAFIGALAAFYKQIRVAHIEAGLRSGNKFSPFPEEANRLLVARLADYHFAPTEKARQNLALEGITKNVHVSGNTGVDALFWGLEIIHYQGDDTYRKYFSFLDEHRKTILVTGHRRENFGKPLASVCSAISEIAKSHTDVQVVYPVHLNPNVSEPVNRFLGRLRNVHLLPPIEYPCFIWLLSKSYLVLTDSGGVQEEAPSLGKPVLVMREVTERTEGVDAGTAKLVGTNREMIVEQVSCLLTDSQAYNKMAKAHNPYGDGSASRRVAAVLRNELP